MWPALVRGAAQLSPYALRAMGVGRNAGSLLGTKAQMIQPPEDLSQRPTAPFAQSEIGKALQGIRDLGGNVSGFLQQKAAAADQGGVDEAGFASAYPNAPAQPTQPLPPLPTVAVNSIPQPGSQALSLDPVASNSMGMSPPASVRGPDLIQKFMQQLQSSGPGPHAYDRAGASTGW